MKLSNFLPPTKRDTPPPAKDEDFENQRPL